jgi:hypothetical protein
MNGTARWYLLTLNPNASSTLLFATITKSSYVPVLVPVPPILALMSTNLHFSFSCADFIFIAATITLNYKPVQPSKPADYIYFD